MTKFGQKETIKNFKGTAGESQKAAIQRKAKPPNLDKKLNFKIANERRVPLADSLGWVQSSDV
jgi:hypothetical protein